MKPSDLSQSVSFTQSFPVSISPLGLRLVVGEKVDQGEQDLQTFLQTSKSRELRVEFSGTGGMLYCLCVLKYVLVWSVEILAPNNLWRATGPASLSHCFKQVASILWYFIVIFWIHIRRFSQRWTIGVNHSDIRHVYFAKHVFLW